MLSPHRDVDFNFTIFIKINLKQHNVNITTSTFNNINEI